MVIRVSVVYSPAPRQVHEVALTLADGCSVRQALQASGLLAQCPELASSLCVAGIWGRKATPDQTLRDNDRVELYRPLTVDPKVARRERFRKQGARSTGLFARKRAGAKAGY
jgi:uncharacterized protein